MTKNTAELVLRGKITLQEALEIEGSHKKLDKEIEKSCIKQGIAMTTMRYTYGNVPKRHHSKYRA